MTANKQQKKKAPLWLKSIAFTIWGGVFFVLLFIAYKAFTSDDPNYESSRNGEKMGDFTRYQGNIYASVPSNGNYLIKADATSFKSLNDQTLDRQIGLDKDHVFCGNRILPNLNPNTTYSLGNQYVSDGNLTYFCAFRSEQNPQINWYQEVWQSFLYAMEMDDKPQTYLYPYKLLPQGISYQKSPNLDRFTPVAISKTQAFYRGYLMPQANPNTLRTVAKQDDRRSVYYVADGKNVYFKHHKIPVQDNPELYVLRLGAVSQHFLIDPTKGMVYIKDRPFNPQFAPYDILTQDESHIANILFASKSGIYFYDFMEDEIKRAGDNPFYLQNFKQIAPLIFSNGKQTLFIDRIDHIRRSRRGTVHSSRSTHIFRADKLPSQQWTKIGDVNRYFGSVWRNKEAFYYFDNLGENQLIFHPIYKIQDSETVNFLLSRKVSGSSIRQLIYDEKLTPIESTSLVEAKIVLVDDRDDYLYIYIFVVVMALIVNFVRRKEKKRGKLNDTK